MNFERDTSINAKICEGIEIINGKVYMWGCYIQFMNPVEFLEEFNVEEYMKSRNELDRMYFQ